MLKIMIFLLTLSLQIHASEVFNFPKDFKKGILYTTVNRGSIKEEIYTSRKTIKAIQSGKPAPYGSIITMIDSTAGKVNRYVVMRKEKGWGNKHPKDKRNGDWNFKIFNPDMSPQKTNTSSCLNCHKPHADHDYIQTYFAMKNFKLK